jgi:hypothetical protein
LVIAIGAGALDALLDPRDDLGRLKDPALEESEAVKEIVEVEVPAKDSSE